MTPDEVRMLDNEKAILFIRGERPILDQKYDITKHPNYKESADGNGQEYHHGDLTEDIAMVELVPLTEDAKDLESDEQYILLDGSEIEELLEEEKEGGDQNASHE